MAGARTSMFYGRPRGPHAAEGAIKKGGGSGRYLLVEETNKYITEGAGLPGAVRPPPGPRNNKTRDDRPKPGTAQKAQGGKEAQKI
jgi:hypothetical protein